MMMKKKVLTVLCGAWLMGAAAMASVKPPSARASPLPNRAATRLTKNAAAPVQAMM